MIRFHDLRHSTATLLLEQGVEFVAKRELLGHVHIGVTATVSAHVRLCLQRDAIDLLGRTLGKPFETTTDPDDSDGPPLVRHPSADIAVNYCRQEPRKASPRSSARPFCHDPYDQFAGFLMPTSQRH
ncbi:hypothetical protein [Streptomyces sp. NBC_00829]|uniref:hypothetical protein n=1 Tax=Streptomyces sp. NBC_00829 TaxID=2903679 RepID=UPI003868C1E7